MTKLVVPIFVTAAPDAIIAMRRAAAAGADMVELRCDAAEAAAIRAVLTARRQIKVGTAHLPVILTIRSGLEGGGFLGSDGELAHMYRHAMLSPDEPEFVDVELRAWLRSDAIRKVLKSKAGAKSPSGARLIVSSHDLAGRPADGAAALAAMQAVDQASILKLVWMAGRIEDAWAALALYSHHAARDSRPLVCLAMGPAGVVSRLLAAKFGAPFTFATVGTGGGSAPGQPSLQELKNLYRWDKQQKSTRVFGVVGWPVGHSISPAIHNAGFAAIDFDGVYVPLAIEADYWNFCAAVDAARQCPGLNLGGISVTIPHKNNALRYVLDRGGAVDEVSRHIQAINTILFSPDGTIRGMNTDYAGALNALTRVMAIDRPGLSGRRAAVLGAGGAARAIVAALAACGADVTIFNRGMDKAATLAGEFNGHTGSVVAAPLDSLCHQGFDIYINCTPVGMSPHIAASPVPQSMAWNRQTVVFDTVYSPHETQMLQLARAKGAVVVHGVEMLIEQALLQFTGFTGRSAPESAMRQAALAALAVLR